GWKDTSVDNMLAAIEAKRAPDAARLLFGLGIRHVGAVTARALRKRCVTLERLRDVAVAAQTSDDARAELISIDGIGPAVVEALGDFFHEPHNVAVWDDLLREVSPPPYMVETRDSAVVGKTVVFTGALETMSRDEAKAQAERCARCRHRFGQDRSGGGRARRRIKAEEGGGTGDRGDR
ncbi:MAG: helix-hairpin-helix domain-containing protein, partial [Usitatibacteraceae bacterium]